MLMRKRNIPGSEMTRNISMLTHRRERDFSIFEALMKKLLNPTINRQNKGFGRTLKVFRLTHYCFITHSL